MAEATEPSVRWRNTRWDIIAFQNRQILFSRVNLLVLGFVAVMAVVQNGHVLAFDPLAGAVRVVAQVAGTILVIWILLTLVFLVGVVGSKNKAIFCEHVLTLTPTGLVEETPYNRNETYWPAVVSVEQMPGYVLVFPTQMTAYIVPADAFGTQEALDKFVVAAREHIARARPGTG